MGELSERFEDKYGVNVKTLTEEVLLDFPVKSIGIDQALKFYFEKKGSEIEVDDTFLKEFVEALADSKFTLPAYAKTTFDPHPTFEIPKLVAPIPKSKGLIYDFKGIVGSDDLRPAMKGIYVDENGYVVGTDAHKLISVKTKELSHHEGKIIDVKRFIDSAGKRVEYIDERYSDWKAVMPTGNLVVKDVDLVSFNNYLAGCQAITKYITNYYFHINLTLGEVPITFNLPIIQAVVKFLLARGYERANFEYTAANRPMLIKTSGDAVWGLVMPMMTEVGSETGTKRKTLYEIQNEYSSKANEKPKARKVEVERKKEEPKGKYDLSQLSQDEQAQAKELMEAIETFQFLLDSMFEDKKMAVGGIIKNTEKYHVWSDSLRQYVSIYGNENLDKLYKELQEIEITSFPKTVTYEPTKEKEIFLKYKNKMAEGGLVQAFSSPQLVDGMYGAISTFAKGGMVEAKQIAMEFAQGGQMVTREQRINAYKQMLAEGGQTYAEAQDKWNKDAGLPTKQDAMNFVKEHPEVLLKRGGRPKKK